MQVTSSPWGKPDHVDMIAPGIAWVSTPSHGGALLDPQHVTRIPASIGAGYSGSRAAWEEDCDWAVAFLLFEREFKNWELVKALGTEKVRENALACIAYRPDWVMAIKIARGAVWRGKCTNAEPGTFNHECGQPGTWLGEKESGFQTVFCDHCKEHGYEARPVSVAGGGVVPRFKWERIGG